LVDIEPGGVATTVPGDPGSEAFGVNLDFDGDGRLLGIEAMSASAALPPAFLGALANRNASPS
jgi:Protein of unknown function (DUF2283)